MKQIQIGLAGCGAFGECHLQTLAAEPRAKVMALFDIVGDRAAALAAPLQRPEDTARASTSFAPCQSWTPST
jgi:predicted dehydrogenase